MNKVQIRNEIEKRISTYSDEELFASRAFEEILQHAVEACCAELGRIPEIHASYKPESDETSCTEGTDVYHNTASPLIRYLGDLWQKYVANIGVVTHECLHILFTDFLNINKLIKGYNVEFFEWYPKAPKGGNEVVEYCRKYPNYGAVYVNALANMVNIMEDAYIENRGYEKFGGVCTAGLTLARKENYRISHSYEELFTLLVAKKADPLFVLNALMMYDRMGFEIKHSEPSEMTDMIFANPVIKEFKENVDQFLIDSKKVRDVLAFETDGVKRCELFNELAMMMFKFMPQPQDNEDDQQGDGSSDDQQKEGDSSDSKKSGKGGKSDNNSSNKSGKGGRSSNGSRSSSDSKPEDGDSEDNQSEGGQSSDEDQNQQSEGSKDSSDSKSNDEQSDDNKPDDQDKGKMEDISEDKAKELNSQGNDMLKKSGMSEKAHGHTRPVDKGKDIDKEEIERKKQNAEDLSSSKKAMEEYVKDAIKKAVTEEVMKEDEKQHERDLKNEADKIDREASKHKPGNNWFCGLNLLREHHIDKGLYNHIYSGVSTSSKALTRKISDILKDRKTEGYDSGYLMGQRFNATDVYHGDGKYFSREVVPDGQPNVVFSVLVDESGSMAGMKNVIARRSAILLEDTLRNLGIPHAICGHDEGNGMVRIYSYVDYDTNDGNDRYRLANINARSGNIDGAAITYMAEKLLKRPEEIKVLIVISDGEPAGTSYYGSRPEEDTMKAIAYYRKKNIKIFGTILDDYKNVSEIYGPNYSFDCRKEDSLQKELIKLVKKYVLIQ